MLSGGLYWIFFIVQSRTWVIDFFSRTNPPPPYHTHIITLETCHRDSLLRYDSILWASNTEHGHLRFYVSPTIIVTLCLWLEGLWGGYALSTSWPFHCGERRAAQRKGVDLRGGAESTSGDEACGSPSVALALSWPSGDICTLESGCIHEAYAQRDPVSSKSSHHPLFKFYTQPGGHRLDFYSPLIAGPKLSGHRCECSTGGDDPSSCGNQCYVLWVSVKSFTWSGHLGSHGQLECPVLHSCKFLCSSFLNPGTVVSEPLIIRQKASVHSHQFVCLPGLVFLTPGERTFSFQLKALLAVFSKTKDKFVCSILVKR